MSSREEFGFGTLSPTTGRMVAYPAWIATYFRPYLGGALLEGGIGYANYRRHYAVDAYHGVDVDAAVVEAAARDNPKDTFHRLDLGDPAFSGRLHAATGGLFFDSAICLNTLQYLEDEAAGVRNLVAAVRPGGHVCLLLPAHPRLFGEMDRRSGHRRRYTPADVAAFAATASCEVVRLGYFNPLGAVAWAVGNLRARQGEEKGHGDDAGMILFDRYAVPVSRVLQPLTRRFFGLSVACVLRRGDR